MKRYVAILAVMSLMVAFSTSKLFAAAFTGGSNDGYAAASTTAVVTVITTGTLIMVE